MRAPLPGNEPDRLAALHRYEVLDTPPEPSFDRVTRLAAALFSAPISLVAFIDAERQFLKSAYGLDLRETPRDQAFCAHTIQSGEVLVVLDAAADPRFADNPLVLGPPYMRFYAGAPLETSDGYRLGALCVIDRQPRPRPAAERLAALRDLAAHVSELLEFRRAQRDLARLRDELAAQSRELVKSRELWRKTEQRATMALEAGRMGYWERDADSDRVTFSPALAEMLDMNLAEYDGSIEGWLRHIHPDDRETILAGIEEANRTHENSTFKYRVLTKDGSERWITTTGTYRADEAGQFAGAQGVSWDSTSSERAARALKRSEELFRGLSESAPLGVFRADADNNITYANARFAEILGATEREVLGHGWVRRVHPEDMEALRTAFAESSSQRFWETELRLLLPDGTVRWIEVRISNLRDRARQVVEKTGTIDDITERRQTMEYLREAKEAAEAANRAKDMFLANISHELRTPLNGVLGMNDQLLESGLNAEQREMAQLVKEAARGLLTVVNDMLDLSRIEAGKLSIEPRPFSLRATLQNTVLLFEADARARGLELTTNYAAELPDWFIGDASRIKQILVNYVSNAMKFTQTGGISIEARGETAGGVCDVLLSVRDTGPGIELEAQSRLFRSFSQIDSSSSRRSGGLGLGLAISKRLAELMGGGVGVSSAPGEGSTFWVRLPLECAAPLEAEPRPAPDARGVGRVLLVEDNPINQRVAAGALRKLGWETDVAGNGRTAIDLFRQNEYAVILMDCQMPEMDGYAATKEMRLWETAQGRPSVPIIALTAHAMTGDKERCLEAGMNDYLAKPFGLEELRQALNRWAAAHA